MARARAPAERMNPRPTHRWPRLVGVLPVAAVFLAAALLRLFITGNSDVSWGITVAEKILAGARLYADVIEVNPPASIYLYLPQTALARALSLKPEWLVDASAFLAAALSLWFTARIVRQSKLLPAGASEAAALAVMAFVLTILPMRIFAEREHFALIAALPAIAALTAMAGGKTISPAVQIVAGIGAGLMAACKPYLAFGIVFAAFAAALKARSWRPLFALQNWYAAIVCAVYAVWIWRAFPAFISDILPFSQRTRAASKRLIRPFSPRNALTMVTAPASMKSLEPSLCVSSQTVSLESVHGVRMPMKKLRLALDIIIPMKMKSKPMAGSMALLIRKPV